MLHDSWTWVDRRLDWLPGQSPGNATIVVREASAADSNVVRYLASLGGKRLSFQSVYRRLTQTRWTVRLATRNIRHPVGLCICRHDVDANVIEAFYACGHYPADSLFPQRLLLHAALEKPEVPTTFLVNRSDDELQARLRVYGWSLSHVDHDAEQFTYSLPPYIHFGHRRADVGEDGSEQSPPPEDSG